MPRSEDEKGKERRRMRQVTKDEAERTDHLPDCTGWEDCDCFMSLWRHSEIYQLQLANYRMLYALMTIRAMAESAGFDMRDLEMGKIASKAIEMEYMHDLIPGVGNMVKDHIGDINEMVSRTITVGP